MEITLDSSVNAVNVIVDGVAYAAEAVQVKKDGVITSIWTASAKNVTVTYMVDTGLVYTETRNEGESCFPPSTFTPSKSGWTFVGWREDSTASSSVLSSKAMGTTPVALYAVFTQDVVVTYYDNSTTAKSTKAAVYYNNGNSTSASFKLAQSSRSGWTARGWSTTNAGNASITYSNGSTFARTTNVTLYGLYQQTVTVTYYNNSTSASTTSGTRYWAPAGFIDPSFTLTQATKSGWTARGWSTSNVGNATVTYNNNTTFTRDSNVTLYGLYSATVTVTYYDNSSTAKTATGTMYNAPDGTVGASFSLTQTAKSGWTARGWSTTNAGNATATYNSGVAFTRTSNCTLYGMYQQTITLSYNGNGSTSGSTSAQTGTVYWAPAGTIGVTFKLSSNGFARTDYSFTGWDLGAAGTTVTLTTSKTAYAQWQANPFYWIKSRTIQSGFPTGFSSYKITPDPNEEDGCGFENNLTTFMIGSSSEETGFDFSGSTAAVNTRGHKYIEIVFNSYCVSGLDAEEGYLDSFKVGGVECKSQVNENATITVDISKMSTVSLYLNMGSWSWGNYMYLYINSIRFYS